jgi:hypothetical protein
MFPKPDTLPLRILESSCYQNPLDHQHQRAFSHPEHVRATRSESMRVGPTEACAVLDTPAGIAQPGSWLRAAIKVHVGSAEVMIRRGRCGVRLRFVMIILARRSPRLHVLLQFHPQDWSGPHITALRCCLVDSCTGCLLTNIAQSPTLTTDISSCLWSNFVDGRCLGDADLQLLLRHHGSHLSCFPPSASCSPRRDHACVRHHPQTGAKVKVSAARRAYDHSDELVQTCDVLPGLGDSPPRGAGGPEGSTRCTH